MGYALTGGKGWSAGYRYVGMLQIVLTAVLFLTLPLWKERNRIPEGAPGARREPLALREIIRIPGAKEVLVAFFCYCTLEQTAILWGSTYLVRLLDVDKERAASLASMFFIGITSGRFLSGFMTMKFSDENMVRLGEGIILLGVIVMLLPMGETAAISGLILIGLGCAPLYPCVIHSTPAHFGEENSQAIIGVQMASAYTGTLVMPSVYGILADLFTPALLPWFWVQSWC